MNNQYQAIIFDLGKVVFDLSFDRVFQYWANASDKTFSEIKANFHFDEIFEKFEEGKVSKKEFRAEISRCLNIKLSDIEFDKGWCNLYLDVYEGMKNLLENLQNSYQLVALTNTNGIHEKVWKIKYRDTLKYFDKVFCSHEIKTRKPESEAYQTVLDYLQLKPQQVLFLDDNINNVEGATQYGITSICVSSFQQMTNELLKLGIK